MNTTYKQAVLVIALANGYNSRGIIFCTTSLETHTNMSKGIIAATVATTRNKAKYLG